MLNRMCLWSEQLSSSDTCQLLTKLHAYVVPIVMSNTSCLCVVTKVGVFPTFAMSKLPYLHKGSIGIEKKSPSEIFSEFHVSDHVDSEK